MGRMGMYCPHKPAKVFSPCSSSALSSTMPDAKFAQSISVVLPAYNEELSLAKAVGDALEFLQGAFEEYEVIVVDDGSTDRSAKIVEDLSKENAKLRLLKHGKNLGYGRAIANGFAAARHDLIFFTDADNQFDIRELSSFVPLTKECDAVFGFRIYRYDSVLRCLLSWVYNRMVRILFRIRIRDVDCSFKLFKRKIVEQLVIECDDFFIDTELVARTARLGCPTMERGVRHYPREAGHTSVRPSHIPRTLWTLARMWFRVHFGKTPAAGLAKTNSVEGP